MFQIGKLIYKITIPLGIYTNSSSHVIKKPIQCPKIRSETSILIQLYWSPILIAMSQYLPNNSMKTNPFALKPEQLDSPWQNLSIDNRYQMWYSLRTITMKSLLWSDVALSTGAVNPFLLASHVRPRGDHNSLSDLPTSSLSGNPSVFSTPTPGAADPSSILTEGEFKRMPEVNCS